MASQLRAGLCHYISCRVKWKNATRCVFVLNDCAVSTLEKPLRVELDGVVHTNVTKPDPVTPANFCTRTRWLASVLIMVNTFRIIKNRLANEILTPKFLESY